MSELYDARKVKRAAQNRAYRESHKEELAAYQHAYYRTNIERLRAYHLAYYHANKEAIAIKRKAWREERRKERAATRLRQEVETSKRCSGCFERLRTPTIDGLCGFCRAGVPPDVTSPIWRYQVAS